MNFRELNKIFGNIDIDLLDLILKGSFEPPCIILDAGCGEGKNLPYFIHNNIDIYGVDVNGDALRMLKFVVRSINSHYPLDRFIEGKLENLPFTNNFFDAVLSVHVLHFVKDVEQFGVILDELVRVLKKGGYLFIKFRLQQQGLSVIPPYLSDVAFLESHFIKRNLECDNHKQTVVHSSGQCIYSVFLRKKE